MLAKIGIVIYLIAAVLHFTNQQILLFWLSVVLCIVITGLSMYIRYHQVTPVLKKYRDTVQKMEVDGASDDVILGFMDQETEVDESRLIESPLWMYLLVVLGIFASFILFVIGVMGRINR